MNMPLVLLNRRRRGFTAFSPSTLFSTTAIGIWLDPSDLSTMFSDRAGTTAVTTPGTVVGLRLDKSKGLALGAELVTNGTFVADSNWTKDAGWAISGGVAVATAAAVSSELSQAITVVEGSWYQIEVTATITSGSICARLYQTGEYVQSPVLASGSNRFTLQSGASGSGSAFTNTIALAPLGAFTGTIDNISVRELAGNHAVAPTDAARPIYGVEPKGGRRNLLTYSEQFDNVAWLRTSATPTAGVTDPSGGTAATTLTATATNGQAVQSITGSLGTATNYVGSIWVRRRTGTGSVYLFNPNSGGITEIIITGTWQRYSVSGLGAAFNNAFGVRMTTSGDAVDIAFPQFELGSTATNYQRVLSDYDVTEAGVQTCHYCRYDGFNSSMSTAAIDFTGTDKVSVFAGVRKLSDANYAPLAELSANYDTNSGVITAGSSGTNFLFGSKGSAGSIAIFNAPNPTSLLFTGLGDISGDRATLRVNGTQVAQSTADQGTGNFGNYPMFFGRRGGSANPAFNGRDFGIIVVGKAASAGEITDTETWLAARTSGVTL